MRFSKKHLAAFVASMVIFGTIGILRRMIPLPSDAIAFARGILGSVFLLLVLKGNGRRFDIAAARRGAGWLVLTGAMIGINWILLCEAYNHTSVAVATLCYYMQPVIVILASPLVLGEKITAKKGVCVILSLIGMLLVSGVAGGSAQAGSFRGVLLGLGAAALYAGVVLLNKRITGVPVFEKTILQLASASLVLVPYMIAAGTWRAYPLSAGQAVCLLTAGIVHTGIAYALYFWGVEKLPAQTSALLSYIDPVTAVLLSAVFLHEKMTVWTLIGAALILGSAAFSERKGSADPDRTD